MPADTTTYRYSGDIKRCMQLKGLARQGVQLLGMLMSLGNLSTYQIRRVLDDGSSIKVFSSCGATYAEITAVPVKKVEKKDEEKKEDGKNLVMVYVGHPDNPFSHYTVDNLVKRSLLLYGIVPSVSLEGIGDKRLLILPWPIRDFTATEKEIILTFLKGEGNRVALFSGTDFTSTNAVLENLNSKLQCIAFDDAGTTYLSNVSGYLPLKNNRKQLFWLVALAVGYVVVKQSHWVNAVVKDWSGYGVMYNDITNMIPAAYYNQGNISEEFMTGSGGYLFSNTLGDFEWNARTTGWHRGQYPESYITWEYTDKDEDEIIAWCLANSGYMPFLRLYNPSCPLTSFTYGRYKNFSDTADNLNCYFHSHLAYADNENIIVASFAPSFLDTTTGGITDEETFNAYPVQLFAQWLLWYDLTPSKDMFNSNNCFVLDMPYNYEIEDPGGGGWIPPIQG